ncbi:TRAP transporter large permease [Granulosicoccus antarcticus]|uniref:TRAP transporter large permease protein n=1 Tax=Granulosicoccus antarcticus IMCC3135 TaxID=1192854 RepID=A0A2Z2NQL5_9GAMM|nr:TRAP transporter large permease [Granulosicoccus antarcticus]ASJ72281.1 C4-dicarboxylate TRAP transporter large permease protein DctM [Granulosicoccus antarcticus IMCC3135]
MGLTILILVFALATALSIPIAFALGLAAIATALYEQIPTLIVFQRMVAGINVFSLLAIPFFIFAGEIMMRGGIAIRLVRFAETLVGQVRGGLGVVNVLTSMLFGGISGSAVADTSALGSVMIPMMRERGYDDDYSVNVTVTSSIAGVLIPPSHNMILYALAAGGGISITSLFLAGVVPGILLCICLSVAAYTVAVKRQYPVGVFPGWRAVVFAAGSAIPGFFTAVVIIGGVVSGIFTVTESAAIGVIYALFVTVFFYRTLTFALFWESVVQAIRTTAMVMILVGTAQAFSYFIALYQIPAAILEGLQNISDNKYVLLALINLSLLALGMFMDMGALILICTPIFLPVAISLGMDPVQFGMLLMMNLGLGLTTPPVGGCLFVGCAIAKVRIEHVIGTIWPYYLAILVALLLTTYIPVVSLGLPRLLGY